MLLRSCRRFCTTVVSDGERKIVQILEKRFPDGRIRVTDVSGGCGSMYQVAVASPEFQGKMVIQQHRMVTETLREQIADMHGIQIQTTAMIGNDKQGE